MPYTTCYEDANGNSVRAKVVPSPKKFYDDKYGDSCVRFVFVTFPERLTLQQVRKAARDMFYTYCQHSYDCCGHWYCSPCTSQIKRVRARTWMIPLSWGRNV